MRCQYRYLFHLILKLNLWLWLCLFWSCFSMFSGIRLHWFLKLFGHRTQTTQPSSLFCSCLNISIFTEFPQQSINRLRLPTLFFSLQNILNSHTYGQSFVDLKKNLLYLDLDREIVKCRRKIFLNVLHGISVLFYKTRFIFSNNKNVYGISLNGQGPQTKRVLLQRTSKRPPSTNSKTVLLLLEMAN